ncbi:MAG: DsbA family protein [Pseudomonadota bacterium]
MSLKSLLMPAISQRFLSRERLEKLRIRAERKRQAQGEAHHIHYFHQVDDPYSALAAASLPMLLARYDVAVSAHVVGPPPDSAAPERDKLVAWSRRDAQLLAQRHGLVFSDTGGQPNAADVQKATRLLVAGTRDGRFLAIASGVSQDLWQRPLSLHSGTAILAEATDTAAHLAQSAALRQKLGHYLGATFFYSGEWYWGIDRLHHLERRLQLLGAQRNGVLPVAPDFLFPPPADLQQPVQLAHPQTIDFFVSLRSPYSAIAAARVFELGRRTGAAVRIRYVLPMAMRGLPVPRSKRIYISLDAAREALLRRIPFGRVNDPLGRPAERGLALIPFAERAGKGEAYLLSFMQGVWAEGLDAGSERGLRRIAERAGLDWLPAKAALKDESWRQTAEANRAEMFGLGLWGVPSFRVGDTAVWGQDRLWVVEDELLKTNNK